MFQGFELLFELLLTSCLGLVALSSICCSSSNVRCLSRDNRQLAEMKKPKKL